MQNDERNTMNPNANIESPCTGNCQLEADVCRGCGRKMHEILSWLSFSDQQRKDVMIRVQKKSLE